METSADARPRELRVLSAGAVKRGVAKIAGEFERETGTRVEIEFATVPEIRRRLAAGGAPDLVIATPAVLDDLAARGGLLAGSRGFVGRSRMGVVVHREAPAPDLSGAEPFAEVLREATAVVYNRASSGLYAASLVERLGLAQELRARIVVVDTGAAIMETVAQRGPGAIGLAQISEILVLIERGCPVKLAGPLPEEIQNVTSYEVAVTAVSARPDAARALCRALASDAAKRVFASTGIC